MVKRGASLEAADLTFRYGERAVLRGLDLSIQPGERVALLGANGAGKSTLLSLVSGVRKPASGTLLLDGQPLAALPARERARKVAMVAQDLAAPPAFTVREWVSLGRTPYLAPLRGETARDTEAVESALREAGLEELAGRYVGEVSGGERQRAALALALAQEPSLLLLDEATAHLDVRHQMALLGVVRRLNQEQGVTVLAALHDVNLASLWFDRLIVLHEGRIVADGTPREVARPEVWEQAFGCRVQVLDHPTEDLPLVVLQRGG